MRTAVQETSTRAFLIDVLPTLSARQKAVYEALEAHGPMTNKEVARHFGVDACSITGRVKELRDMAKQLVREWGVRKCGVTGRTAIAWAVVPAKIEQMRLM